LPTGTFADVTAHANRGIFLKRKETSLFNSLVDSISSAALTSCDESGLHVRLELFDEPQASFKNFLGELEELDFEEIQSDLCEKFDDILVILKSSVRSKISQLLRTEILLTASLREFSAPSSVRLDMGQQCPSSNPVL